MSDFNRAGTRTFAEPTAGSGRQGPGDGQPTGRHLPAPLADWMFGPDRACKDYPTLWWYAPQTDPIELRDDQGRVVLRETDKVMNGKPILEPVIIDYVTVSTQEDADRAKTICETCPLNLDCREYGLRHERHGTWGGIRLDGLTGKQRGGLLSAMQRERERRARQRRPA